MFSTVNPQQSVTFSNRDKICWSSALSSPCFSVQIFSLFFLLLSLPLFLSEERIMTANVSWADYCRIQVNCMTCRRCCGCPNVGTRRLFCYPFLKTSPAVHRSGWYFDSRTLKGEYKEFSHKDKVSVLKKRHCSNVRRRVWPQFRNSASLILDPSFSETITDVWLVVFFWTPSGQLMHTLQYF